MKKVSYMLSLAMVFAIAFSSYGQLQTKKGWSPQAKGAVIGAGTGAVAGAVIHKRNRVVGGAVGGAVGAGAGYAIGKHVDNKNKEKARIAAANRVAEANRVAAIRRAEADRIAEANRTAEANRPVLAQKPVQPAKGVMASRTSPGNAVEKEMKQAPLMSYASSTNEVPYIMSMAYLPNESYGDRSKPYATSEYRRKSW